MKRWSPGKGWIRTADYGYSATWMKPSVIGGVEVICYLSHTAIWDLPADRAQIVHIWCPPGSGVPYTVADKIRRVLWPVHDPTLDEKVVRYFQVPATHRTHRRRRRSYNVHRWPLPLPIRRALGDDPRARMWFP